MDLELAGRVAIVTGGSRGIGKAIGRALAREGASVALVARDLAVTQAAAAELAAETKSNVEAFRADTGSDADVKAVVAQIADRFGRIDILVNCAAQPGGSARVPKLADITDADFWADMNIKVLGYIRTAREVEPHMRARGWGRIVNVSGLAALRTGSIIGSVRNVGVAALTKNLADELGPDGINVTCVHPGATHTEKTDEQTARAAAAAGVSTEEMTRRRAQQNSVHRMITASEVADVVTFLASPKSFAITGDSIPVGGGTPGHIRY
jgi:NAD(P)-dependent dehydrogenase (short-subunit alcohol dehydrogenase family)